MAKFKKLPPVPAEYPVYEEMRQLRAESYCLAASQIPGDTMYDPRVVEITKQIETLEQQRLALIAPSVKRLREMCG